MSDPKAAGDPNRHIREYIAYYLDIPQAPYYAVLLKGPWGIGKTFLVKKVLCDLFAGDKDGGYVYVSLYGLGSTKDLDTALFQALYPTLTGKTARISGRVAKAALSFFNVESDMTLSDVLEKSVDKLYVFDDLERTEMPIDEVLGYINELVEHDGRKVVVVAHDEEITDQVGYKRKKEKLIGKTLAVQPSVEEALSHFLSGVKTNSARALLEAHRDDIREIYDQFDRRNLRILQQTIWDAERVLAAVGDDHRNNAGAMRTLIRLLFALSLEFKSAQIDESDIKNRTAVIDRSAWRAVKGKEKGALDLASDRYTGVFLGDTILTDDVLYDILANGLIDAKDVRAALDRSPHFLPPKDEPAWVTLWHSFEREDEDVEAAIPRMEAQFAAREIVVPGEILHVFGLRLWLADIGAIGGKRPDVVKECRRYIADLSAAGRLAPIDNEDQDEIRHSGYGGLAMQSRDTEEFNTLFEELRTARIAASKAAYPMKAAALLEQLTSDIDLFRRSITSNSGGEYARVPVLSAMDPDAFIEMLFKHTPHDQWMVFSALRSRYEHGALRGALSEETAWVQTLCDKLIDAVRDSPPVKKHRVSQLAEALRKHALDRV